ncbi:xyloside xylosyltransferase 1 isoform X2 [Notamacropus eugenii]|uniref:xyloside xylosyltransferase 1 isoform X2 n=1 Tax=Notamacropus eugenii TaxID=9315 RepID=UPI003B67F5A8
MASGGPGGGQAGAAGKLRRGAPCALGRARLGSLRSHQCALLLAGLLAVCAFYYVGSGRETFSSATRRLKESRAGGTAGPAAAPASDAPLAPEAKAKPADGLSAGAAELDLHVLMMFTKADRSPALRAKGRTALSSLLRLAKLDEREVLTVHLVSEEASKEIAKSLLRELLPGVPFKHKVIFHDVSFLTEKLFPVVEAMQKHFSAGSGTYYGDSIFFLSVAMHQIMPKEISRIIQLDLDLKYKTNIRELFEEFDNFPPGAIIGIAREMQPVYRHTFWQFRRENPQTRVGDPPPDGLPGFNSGVMLLNLDAMRQSALYRQLLEPAALQQLTEKYHFQGHLGDQDFFTVVGMEHPELFHVLDCTWNRQLCTWWRDHGYSDVFDAYFRCEGHVRIFHGNCNTPIPED